MIKNNSSLLLTILLLISFYKTDVAQEAFEVKSEFSVCATANRELQIDLSVSDEDLLRKIALDTWEFFDEKKFVKNGLVSDNVWIKEAKIADYTSVTNVGLYLLCVLSAKELGFINDSSAINKINKTLESIKKLPVYNGFNYNWIKIDSLSKPGNFVSSVDAAWFYSSLAVVGEYYPENFKFNCESIISKADFNWLYNDSLHSFNLGYNVKEKNLTPYHYEQLVSEARIITYWSVVNNGLDPYEWFRKHRTLPAKVKQEQTPQGEWKSVDNIKYFEGYYTYDLLKIIPSWGGSLFEYLMPSLLVDEKTLTPLGMGLNNKRAVDVQIDYAKNKMNLPIWGFSPSTTPNGGYKEFGVPIIGSKIDGYEPGIVSPHASIIAIQYDEKEVINNIRKMIELFDIYGEYGFYDSVDPKSGKVGKAYLALDQAMILISLTNYLKDNIIAKRFMNLENFDKIKNVISKEKLFNED